MLVAGAAVSCVSSFLDRHSSMLWSQPLRACCQGQPLRLGERSALLTIGTHLLAVGTERLTMRKVGASQPVRGPAWSVCVQCKERQQETQMCQPNQGQRPLRFC